MITDDEIESAEENVRDAQAELARLKRDSSDEHHEIADNERSKAEELE